MIRAPEGVEFEIVGSVEKVFAAESSRGNSPSILFSLRLMTAKEAADHLRKSRSWIYDHKHELGVVRSGRGRGSDLLFRQSDLDAWVEDRQA